MNSIGQATVSRISTDVQNLHGITLTVRSTVVSETLFGEDDSLGSGGVMQIDDRTGRSGFSRSGDRQ